MYLKKNLIEKKNLIKRKKNHPTSKQQQTNEKQNQHLPEMKSGIHPHSADEL